MTEKGELEQILEECYRSTGAFAKIIFPERFTLPFSGMHEQVLAILDDDSIQQFVVAASRGFGKTSLLNLAYPAKRILFNDSRFITPISNTATQAVMQSENLKKKLLNSSTIKKLFGDQKSDNWSKEQWMSASGIMVLPRGAGQQIRGVISEDDRPDLIPCDDLENMEEVKNEEIRQKMKEWFFADVCNSVNRASKKWRIGVIGTILHEDSLLSNLLEDPEWCSLRLELFDDNYRSNWKEFMDDDGIRSMVEGARNKGLLDLLYREYRNLSISTEDSVFTCKSFKYYEESDIRSNKEVETVVLIDPAKTVKLHSAESAIVGVGVDARGQRIFVRDVIAERLYPDDLYHQTFQMALRLGAHAIGFEVTSLHEFISYPLRNEMMRKGYNFELIELHARGHKEDRVAALAPFYRQGLVFHNKSCCGGLEGQLMSFPRSKRWDIMDALSYIVPMLDVGGRFFTKSDEPDEREEMELEEMEDIEDDYRELERCDEAPVVNWRTI